MQLEAYRLLLARALRGARGRTPAGLECLERVKQGAPLRPADRAVLAGAGRVRAADVADADAWLTSRVNAYPRRAGTQWSMEVAEASAQDWARGLRWDTIEP